MNVYAVYKISQEPCTEIFVYVPGMLSNESPIG